MNDLVFSFGGLELPGAGVHMPSATYVLIAHDSFLATSLHAFLSLFLYVMFGLWLVSAFRRVTK